jgi:hypothetical protein
MFRGIRIERSYVVRFHQAIYVLHCFQKKSPSGIRTPQHDVELIHERLKRARLLGIPQPHVSDLVNYRLNRFSSKLLLHLITLLD